MAGQTNGLIILNWNIPKYKGIILLGYILNAN